MQHYCTSVQIPIDVSIGNNIHVRAPPESAEKKDRVQTESAAWRIVVMKAVLALLVIYVGTFLVAIQGASNSPVEASEQSAHKRAGS